MNKGRLVAIILGIVFILSAPVFGYYLSHHVYLLLIGGMETEKLLLVMDGCITGFQIIGVLFALYGMFKNRNK